MNILFKEDGTVDRANYEVINGHPEDAIKPTYYAEHFHMDASEVAYLGLHAIVSPSTGQRIVIAFTERQKPNQPHVSRIFPAHDTRSIDHSLVQRYFPETLRRGVTEEDRLWVLFNSDGYVVSTGNAPSSSTALTRVLEARFSGIETEFITATPVTDDHYQPINDLSGRPLRLYCVWLRKGSASPGT